MTENNKSMIRESVLLLLLSTVIGLGYAASSGQWLLSHTGDSERSSSPTSSFISLEDAAFLHKKGLAIFIDARHEYDFRQGHIPGAINIPLSEFETDTTLIESLPRNKTVVTYCDGQECNSSVALAQMLLASGFTNVNIFFGGWNEWKSAHAEIEEAHQ